MDKRSRFAFSTGQKAILVIGLLLCVGQALLNPKVFNVLLNFFAAGVVPGTNIVLAPDTVLRFLCATCISAAAIIGYVQFGRHARRPRPNQKIVSISGTRLRAFVMILGSKVIARHGMTALKAVYRTWMFYANVVARWCRNIAAWILPKVRVVTTWVLRIIQTISRVLVSGVIWIMAVESALAIWTWRWLEPRLREFDGWLGRKVNDNPFGAVVVEAARMCRNALVSLRNRLSTSVRSTKNQRITRY